MTPSAPRNRPARPNSTMNDGPSSMPTATSVMSPGSLAGRPSVDAVAALVAPKNGTAAYGWRSPPAASASRSAAAAAPCSAASSSARCAAPRRGGHRRTGDVAGGVDARHGGAQRGVADDAVAQRRADALEPAGDQRHTDADNDHVGLDDGAVAERDAISAHVGDGDIAAQVDPMVDVDPVAATPSSAPRPRTAGPAGLEHRHRQPSARAVAATSRPMKPAPTTTTRAVPSARRARRAARRRGCAARGPRPAARQPLRARPGGDDQPVEGHGWCRRPARRCGHRCRARSRARQGAGRDASTSSASGLRRTTRSGPSRRRAASWKRRAVVGQVRLGPNERDGAVEPVRTQGLARPQAGQRGADDDDAAEPIGSGDTARHHAIPSAPCRSPPIPMPLGSGSPTPDSINEMVLHEFPRTGNDSPRSATTTPSPGGSSSRRTSAPAVTSQVRRSTAWPTPRSGTSCSPPSAGRADGAHVRAVDALPPPRRRRDAVGQGDARHRRAPQRRRTVHLWVDDRTTRSPPSPRARTPSPASRPADPARRTRDGRDRRPAPIRAGSDYGRARSRTRRRRRGTRPAARRCRPAGLDRDARDRSPATPRRSRHRERPRDAEPARPPAARAGLRRFRPAFLPTPA